MDDLNSIGEVLDVLHEAILGLDGKEAAILAQVSGSDAEDLRSVLTKKAIPILCGDLKAMVGLIALSLATSPVIFFELKDILRDFSKKHSAEFHNNGNETGDEDNDQDM